MFSLIYAWTNGWVDNRDVGDLRRRCPQYGVNVMIYSVLMDVIILPGPNLNGGKAEPTLIYGMNE